MRSPSDPSTAGASHTRIQTGIHTRFRHNARITDAGVSTVLARALLDAAETQGARRQSLQAAADCALDGPEVGQWIDLPRFSRLIEAAVDQTGDPAFGLHWGERSPVTNFGIVSSLAHWSPSPRTALAALTRFQGLLFQGRPVASFQVCGQVATLRCELSLCHPAARRAWAEFVVVGASLLLQQLCGHGSTTLRLRLEHAAPPYVNEYRRILGDAIAFETGICDVEFDAALLDRTLPEFNERLNEAVLFEASCALARAGGQKRCSARVREQLVSAWPTVPTMDEMARKLGMSSRTLRRHLEYEGTAYPSLVAEALRSRALRLLGDPEASVKEVAYALGFATPSAFHRAFKRWTGSSPSEARLSATALER